MGAGILRVWTGGPGLEFLVGGSGEGYPGERAGGIPEADSHQPAGRGCRSRQSRYRAGRAGADAVARIPTQHACARARVHPLLQQLVRACRDSPPLLSLIHCISRSTLRKPTFAESGARSNRLSLLSMLLCIPRTRLGPHSSQRGRWVWALMASLMASLRASLKCPELVTAADEAACCSLSSCDHLLRWQGNVRGMCGPLRMGCVPSVSHVSAAC